MSMKMLHTFMVFLHSSVLQRLPGNRQRSARLAPGMVILIGDRQPRRIRCLGVRGSCAPVAHESSSLPEDHFQMPSKGRCTKMAPVHSFFEKLFSAFLLLEDHFQRPSKGKATKMAPVHADFEKNFSESGMDHERG